jgi:hypothetical protein
MAFWWVRCTVVLFGRAQEKADSLVFALFYMRVMISIFFASRRSTPRPGISSTQTEAACGLAPRIHRLPVLPFEGLIPL